MKSRSSRDIAIYIHTDIFQKPCIFTTQKITIKKLPLGGSKKYVLLLLFMCYEKTTD